MGAKDRSGNRPAHVAGLLQEGRGRRRGRKIASRFAYRLGENPRIASELPGTTRLPEHTSHVGTAAPGCPAERRSETAACTVYVYCWITYLYVLEGYVPYGGFGVGTIAYNAHFRRATAPPATIDPRSRGKVIQFQKRAPWTFQSLRQIFSHLHEGSAARHRSSWRGPSSSRRSRLTS